MAQDPHQPRISDISPPPPFPPIERLEIRDLAVDRGGRRVLDGVSGAVAAGHGLAVTGPNGTGKSTLLRVLAGLLRPVEGKVDLIGADPERPANANVHYVGHLDAVKTQETVGANMAFWARWLGGDADPEILEEALSAFELDHLFDLPAAYLSAGQRRRLSLSRLLAAPRAVWLLDEPTVALDVRSETRLAAVMDRHLDAGGIVVAATHSPIAVDRLGAFPIAAPA
ncbi:heme ABC exporter ATP-binding protein CcmA [Amorphus coralli]|uniref:heme ABC exporter ATP-binding protein CcmA n=1 Tax=Amorphus coralli TaxID=340680 RepID=UPI000370CA5A|nr:heme ABC exporter ATP-binding protein CcmA [Amorphus coralli]